MASMAYGEPRLTIDIDIVAELTFDHVSLLCFHFSAPEYNLSESAACLAISRRAPFNIIHPISGLKVDLFVPKDTEFARLAAQRIRRIKSPGEYDVWFGSPEDILLNKLLDFQMGGGVSEKHLRDMAGMMKLLGKKLDRNYVSEWASKLGVSMEWTLAQQRIDKSLRSEDK